MSLWSWLLGKLGCTLPVHSEEVAYFAFGLLVAEHHYQIPNAQRINKFLGIYDVARPIAEGEVTLVDTPEEFMAGKDYPMNRDLPKLLQAGRLSQKEMARKIVAHFKDIYGQSID